MQVLDRPLDGPILRPRFQRPWPKSLPYRLTPRIGIVNDMYQGLSPLQRLDAYAEVEAKRRQALNESIVATGLTGQFLEPFYCNEADFSAFNTSASEGSLLSGANRQPTIPAGFFVNYGAAYKFFTIEAQGIFGTTSTPTLTFQVRMGTTQGASTLTGSSIGVSAAITTASGVSNKYWYLWLRLVCTVRGQGTGNATLAGAGYVMSPSGFASPFFYPLEMTTPDTATWTQTFDAALTQYVNLSATWSASSASNTITCKQLAAYMS